MPKNVEKATARLPWLVARAKTYTAVQSDSETTRELGEQERRRDLKRGASGASLGTFRPKHPANRGQKGRKKREQANLSPRPLLIKRAGKKQRAGTEEDACGYG